MGERKRKKKHVGGKKEKKKIHAFANPRPLINFKF